MVAPPPELLPMSVAAAHCWRFSAGWFPERWPAYDALHHVEDWQMLIELMQILRDAQ